MSLDFDDPLRAYDGTPVPGAIETLESLRGDGELIRRRLAEGR